MPTDFKPPRRELGIVTLLMACVLTTCWVRGTVTRDVVEVRHNFCFTIDQQAISFAKLKTLPLPTTSFLALGEPDPYDEIYSAPNTVTVSFGRARLEPVIVVPFWSIVLPATLFSAWLLLSKPRAKKTPENQPQNL